MLSSFKSSLIGHWKTNHSSDFSLPKRTASQPASRSDTQTRLWRSYHDLKNWVNKNSGSKWEFFIKIILVQVNVWFKAILFPKLLAPNNISSKNFFVPTNFNSKKFRGKKMGRKSWGQKKMWVWQFLGYDIIWGPKYFGSKRDLS